MKSYMKDLCTQGSIPGSLVTAMDWLTVAVAYGGSVVCVIGHCRAAVCFQPHYPAESPAGTGDCSRERLKSTIGNNDSIQPT